MQWLVGVVLVMDHKNFPLELTSPRVCRVSRNASILSRRASFDTNFQRQYLFTTGLMPNWPSNGEMSRLLMLSTS